METLIVVVLNTIIGVLMALWIAWFIYYRSTQIRIWAQRSYEFLLTQGDGWTANGIATAIMPLGQRWRINRVLSWLDERDLITSGWRYDNVYPHGRYRVYFAVKPQSFVLEEQDD